MQAGNLAPYNPPPVIHVSSASMISSLFFTPLTPSQLRQKRIIELRGIISKLSCELEKATDSFNASNDLFVQMSIQEDIKRRHYRNHTMICRVNSHDYRRIVTENIPEVMSSDLDDSDEALKIGINRVTQHFNSIFPVGKDNPFNIKERSKIAFEAAQAKCIRAKAQRENDLAKQQEIINSLTKAQDELKGLYTSIAQTAASAPVSDLVSEFERSE